MGNVFVLWVPSGAVWVTVIVIAAPGVNPEPEIVSGSPGWAFAGDATSVAFPGGGVGATVGVGAGVLVGVGATVAVGGGGLVGVGAGADAGGAVDVGGGVLEGWDGAGPAVGPAGPADAAGVTDPLPLGPVGDGADAGGWDVGFEAPGVEALGLEAAPVLLSVVDAPPLEDWPGVALLPPVATPGSGTDDCVPPAVCVGVAEGLPVGVGDAARPTVVTLLDDSAVRAAVVAI